MKNEVTAKRLRFALSEANMKPQELADKSGVSKSSISQYVNGSHSPSNISSGKMGKVLNVNPLWLMGFEVPMSPSSIFYDKSVSVDSIVFEITGKSLKHSPLIFDAICRQFKKMIRPDSNNVTFTKNAKTIHNIYELLMDNDTSYDDKAHALNSIIDIIIYDIKKKELQIHYILDKPQEETELSNIISTLKKLNLIGLSKVFDYANDLSNMFSYTNKQESGETIANPPKKSNLSGVADAANAITNASIEDKRYDEDIMNDENF